MVHNLVPVRVPLALHFPYVQGFSALSRINLYAHHDYFLLPLQEEFEKLKGTYGGKLEEDQIWEKAVKGEDSRGRLFGFGFRGRTSKSTRVPETMEMSPSGPTRSTATSAEDPNRPYTKEEVERMISEERTTFFEKFVAQDERHRAEMDRLIKLQESFEKFRACFELLFKQHNIRPPPFFNVSNCTTLS